MDNTTDLKVNTARKSRTKGIALAVGGLLVGGALAGTISAAAATSPTPTATSDSSTSTPDTGVAPDESQPQRSDETLLTGDLLQQVTDAALAEYPGATIIRVETDSDGVYEAHLTAAAGDRVTVEFDEDLAVTGTEPGGGPGGRGGPGDDADDSASSSTG